MSSRLLGIVAFLLLVHQCWLGPTTGHAVSIAYIDSSGKVLTAAPKDVPVDLGLNDPWWADRPWSELREQPAPGGGMVMELIRPTKESDVSQNVTLQTQAATFTIQVMDGAGEGFNDTTPATPVGGNTGTTLGQQRLIAFQYAASLWGNLLNSTVPIVVTAQFDPLTCEPTYAILGQAGATSVYRDFVANPPYANTWFVVAQANALAGTDLNNPDAEINATFNSTLDSGSCLGGTRWYYGLDATPPSGYLDFVSVLLHELAHGLGFLTRVNLSTGQKLFGYDDIYMVYLRDESLAMGWPQMSNTERKNSAIDTGDLTWTGTQVTARAGGYSNGVHASGRIEMYAPNPLELGSSVSHFSKDLTPNELMEPSYTGPQRNLLLTTALFADIGWPLAVTSTPTSTPANTATPTPTRTNTSTPANTLTPTRTATSTATNTFTPTPTNTSTTTNTFTPVPTNTYTVTNTFTPTPTNTYTVTNTSTLTPTRTNTFTPANTLTPTSTNTPNDTVTHTPTHTDTLTASVTNTPTDTLICLGDADRNGFVNGTDYAVVRDHYGAVTCGPGDANGDCFVSTGDYRAVRENFGLPCP